MLWIKPICSKEHSQTGLSAVSVTAVTFRQGKFLTTAAPVSEMISTVRLCRLPAPHLLVRGSSAACSADSPTRGKDRQQKPNPNPRTSSVHLK